MWETKKDAEATRLARRYKVFISRDSWISNSGHVYLAGTDATNLRNQVMLDAKFRCAICEEFCGKYDGDLHHIGHSTPLSRCWCYNTKLADGTTHTNVEWIHGMFSRRGCHRKIHNREVSWTPKSL